MPRSIAAYLADILDACDAIDEVLSGVDLATYQSKRSIRSSVERERECAVLLGRTGEAD